ncbi:MAG: helix-turn-helix domain-containing protein [Thermomicrobiales bacterium]|nr:helix-turn-helix domain-containing protein [Thermomicrobiales bacterium]
MRTGKHTYKRSSRSADASLHGLARAVKSARKRSGMTQAELAKAIGASQGNIARLESGQHAPSVRVLQNIAIATDSRLTIDLKPLSHRRFDMLQTTRRHFLEGAAGLAGTLGLGNVRYATAEEATAAAAGIESYVWTRPEYDPEPSLFTITDRTDDTVTVETIDGVVEVPADPKRIVSLGWEYISLFELGLADRVVAVTFTTHGTMEDMLWGAGDKTADLIAAYADVDFLEVGHNGVDLDVEQLMLLEPDLILSSPSFDYDMEMLNSIAPVIRGTAHAPMVPRACIRDYGALFGLDDVATTLLEEHEAYAARAREAVVPVIEGKKAIVIVYYPESGDCYGYASYYKQNGGIFTTIEGAYQLQREMNITPSSFIEQLSDEKDRESYAVPFSFELIGHVDVDHIFLYRIGDSYDVFVNSPSVQQTVAGGAGQIYDYDPPSFGFGLGGVQATLTWMVEQMTGEAFG